MPETWFREADQRCGRYGFEVLTSTDGMVSQYRKTTMATDKMVVEEFKGEASCHAAMRRFTEDVLKEMY